MDWRQPRGQRYGWDTWHDPITKVYSVGDLVVPMPPAGAKFADKPTTREADLIKKIMVAIEPTHWKRGGGKGTIEYFPLGMALVVNATPIVHAAIEKYLEELRKIEDTQFQVKVMVLTVTDAGLERMGLARDFIAKDGAARTRIKFLSAEDLRDLDLPKTEFINATMPTITTLNGQEGCINVGQVEHFLTGVTVTAVEGQLVFEPKNQPYELGTVVKLRPSLSADQRFIKLAVSAQARDLTIHPVGQKQLSTPIRPVYEDGKLGEPVTFTQFLQDPRILTRSVDETVTMPDGGTVVFYGGPARCEETVREHAPMFADVPFLNELFSRDKKVTSTNHLLVFATPRVIKPVADECVQCAGGSGKLAKVLGEYHRACREGNSDEARRLAMECLVIDPTSFGQK